MWEQCGTVPSLFFTSSLNIPGERGEKASRAGVNALGVARYCNECQMNTKHRGNTFEKPSFWRKYSDFPHFN